MQCSGSGSGAGGSTLPAYSRMGGYSKAPAQADPTDPEATTPGDLEHNTPLAGRKRTLETRLRSRSLVALQTGCLRAQEEPAILPSGLDIMPSQWQRIVIMSTLPAHNGGVCQTLPAAPGGGDLLTLPDLARKLRLHPTTARGLYRRGVIPGLKLGHRTLRFEYAAVLDALRQAKK